MDRKCLKEVTVLQLHIKESIETKQSPHAKQSASLTRPLEIIITIAV